MGNWTIIIQGAGAHHNFKQVEANALIPDGEGDFERTCEYDADYLSARFVRELKSNGQNVTAATFTSGGTDDISKDRHVLKAEL
jgi:hypothetical protein